MELKKCGPYKRVPRKNNLRVAGAGELDLPKNDEWNIWDSEFGWILKEGRPTKNTKAYWEKKRREPKQ